MYPDPCHYDVGFVSLRTMENLYGMQDMANSFTFTLQPGYEIQDVKDQVEELLKPYGCYSVYGREDHQSASMLNSELSQLEEMAGGAAVSVSFCGGSGALHYHASAD